MNFEARRAKFREDYLYPLYSGKLHFAFTIVLCLGVITAALYLLDDFRLSYVFWLIGFWIANSLLEYLSHRYHQHQKTPGLGFLYQFHSFDHHQLFHHDNMSIESSRDMYMVLFPPSVTLGLLFVWFPGWSAVIWMLGFRDLALLYYVASVAGYLLYELVHFSSHHSENSIYYRLPILSRLCLAHKTHHDPRFMTKGNFGIVTTLWDRLLRTRLLSN